MSEINNLNYKLRRAMNQKERLEAQISSNGDILNYNNVGMNEPLVDNEGYPRRDIDIYEVRRARQNIICLQNDYKTLMREIEGLMHLLHSKYKDEGYTSNNNDKITEVPFELSQEIKNPPSLQPILKVSQVGADSPAEQAGLCNGDEILEIGSINFSNFKKNLEPVTTIIHRMQNQRIPLLVLRQNVILNMILIPKTWSGDGLLGCKVSLID